MRHWRNGILSVVTALAILLSACSALPNTVIRKTTPVPSQLEPTPSAAQTQWEKQIQQGIPNEDDTYFIKSMPEEQRKLCIGIYQSIMAFETEIKFPEPVDEKTLSDAMWILSYDCPELFQISGDYSYYVREDMPDQVLSVKPNYILSETEYKQACEKIQSTLSQWLQKAKWPDAYALQKHIYDQLITNCKYREDGVYSGTAYGALVLGEARCEGYSKALCMALRAAGMPCLILTGEAWTIKDGKASQPEKHAWNVAKIGDHYYQMDATWDDSDGVLPMLSSYAYFNLTDSEMYASRSLDEIYSGLQLPVCDDNQANYYVQSGTFFSDGVDLKKALYGALDAAYERGEKLVLARVETDTQLKELQSNIESWMSGWYKHRRFTSGSYNWTTYDSSRVFCVLDLNYGK